MKELLQNFLASKLKHFLTVFLTLLVTSGIITTEAAGDLGAQGATVITGLVGLVLALGMSALGRFLSKDISKQDPSGGNQGSGGSLVLLLCCTMALGLMGFSLASCSALSKYPVTGSLYLRDAGSGAKGGLVFTPGEQATGFIKVPLLDPDTGAVIGMAEVSAPIQGKASTVRPEK